jgi:hypothetical protein
MTPFPSNTDLYIVLGTNKVNLCAQKPLIWVIVQDAIEDLQALMLFNHPFPNAATAITFIWECLVDVADKYRPGASVIYE